MGDLIAVFLTGLLTGGLSCLAVQGGLLASSLAQREEEKLKEKTVDTNNALPIIAFLTTKLVAYTLLGLLLGALGSVFQLSLTAKLVMQLIVVFFMAGTALNLLNVHPVFRYFVIQPPRFLTKLVRNQTKSRDVFAPAILGAFTIFIPCGTTQAMMALAIGSGNPMFGAAIMFSFILGTSPVFFILGYFATRLGETLHEKFMKIAGVAILLLALFNLNNALALSGSSFTVESVWANIYCTVSFCNDNQYLLHDVPTAAATSGTIELTSGGYSPGNLTLKAGSDVTLHLVNSTGRGCIQAFTIPTLGIQEIVRTGTNKDLTFRTPDQPTQLAFMCSMGMYRGTITVL